MAANAGRGELVDVVDERDRPLAVMRLAEVHQQRLAHRAVFILVYNGLGKVYLQKRSSAKTLYPGRWDISASGHVQAGEPRLLAAHRELEEELNLTPPALKELCCIPASVETGYEVQALFSAGVVHAQPRPNPAEVETGAFYDPEELSCLAKHFRNQLTPALVYFWERGLLFPG